MVEGYQEAAQKMISQVVAAGEQVAQLHQYELNNLKQFHQMEHRARVWDTSLYTSLHLPNI